MRKSINQMRAELREIDLELIGVIAKRVEHVVRLSGVKRELGLPIRSPEIEAETLSWARSMAISSGLSPEVITEVFKILIQDAVRIQQNMD